MTIRATNTNQRPIAPTGSKPRADATGKASTAKATDARQTDRLSLSPEASKSAEASADSLNAAELAKVRAITSETKQPETTRPETKAGAGEGTSAQAGPTTTSPEAKPPEEPNKPKTDIPERPLRNFLIYHPSLRPMTEQQAIVEEALAGKVMTFKNSAGNNVRLAIVKDSTKSDGTERYEVKVEFGSIDVTVAPGLDAKLLLTRLVDAYSKVPEHLRKNLKKVELETRHNPGDEYWAKTFGNQGFASGATAGNGTITFWNLKDNVINLCESTFNHEMGHLIGEDYSASRETNSTRVPHGWKDAQKADGVHVSQYSTNNGDEDFAETWSYFVYALTDPEAMKALTDRVPNRVRILDAIYKNEFDRKHGLPVPAPQPEGNGNG